MELEALEKQKLLANRILDSVSQPGEVLRSVLVSHAEPVVEIVERRGGRVFAGSVDALYHAVVVWLHEEGKRPAHPSALHLLLRN